MFNPAHRRPRSHALPVAPRRFLTLLAITVTLGACGTDNGVTNPPPTSPDLDSITVDASQQFAYVRLGEPTQVVTVDDPATSTAWDIGFYTTTVTLDGGEAGPAGVVGYCICQNASATDDALQQMTPASERADFDNVTAAQIPTDDAAWASDALDPAIQGWYAYDPDAHVVSAAPELVWKVRTASGTAFAKLHITNVDGATETSAGDVTIEYALQPSSDAAMEAPQTITVSVTADAPTYVDLQTGATSDAEHWDLALQGYTIRLNGGVSGSGMAAAAPAGAAFADVTTASDLPSVAYSLDAFGGVFDAHAWYRYDLAGQHQIWPTYDVYLIKRGSAVYKIQLIGYYGPAGETRQITFRYARLAE